MDIEGLKTRLQTAGQTHLLKFWDSLDECQRQKLYDDLDGLNYQAISGYFERCTHAEPINEEAIEPVPKEACGGVPTSSPDEIKKYEGLGLQAIADGTVAALLLAGGQGTRLGGTDPKGMYSGLELLSKKTLYQIQAERIIKLQQIASSVSGKQAAIPWYIMTSEHTMERTEQFFIQHGYFGLDKANVIFFEQNTLPCMTLDGKVILEQKDKVARAPDGNGGLYSALRTNKILEDFQKRGIKMIHVYCVDNILVKMADPVFIGFCMTQGAQCGTKVVKKAFPSEPVSIICRLNGIYQVVSYSEISKQTAEKTNADGNLVFSDGEICNHFFTVDFLNSVVRDHESKLVHHRADKKIPFVDDSGQHVKPTSPNGIKMEKFVFDVFQFCSKLAVWEVLREDEFSPLKNADGASKDTPTTSRQSLYNMHSRWVIKTGGQFLEENGSIIQDIPSQQAGDDESAVIQCEISPLISYAGEGLEEFVKGKKFKPPLLLKDK